MKSRHRFALSLWLALAATSCLATPSSAQNAAARSAAIAELNKACKYSEAIPLAQKLLADMERTYGPDHRDVAASLNNLGMIYGSTRRDTEAEPSLVLGIPANPSELDDGLLTSSEVAQLKLNADWVVLSACNTIAATSLAPRRCPASRARSFMPARGRSW
jgi:hypothetical protein